MRDAWHGPFQKKSTQLYKGGAGRLCRVQRGRFGGFGAAPLRHVPRRRAASMEYGALCPARSPSWRGRSSSSMGLSAAAPCHVLVRGCVVELAVSYPPGCARLHRPAFAPRRLYIAACCVALRISLMCSTAEQLAVCSKGKGVLSVVASSHLQ
jgi:hypothetical protein